MPPTTNLGYLLHHLAFTLDRQSDQVLQDTLDIGFSQFKLLMALKWRPSVQQKNIAEHLGQTEASISRQIKLMIEMGLLKSTVSPQNRREHITTLTTKGERVAQQAWKLLNNYHATMFERLTSEDQANLRQILQVMHNEACSGNKPGACNWE